jgi:predicted acyltransferase
VDTLQAPRASESPRLRSLDALRGFDMSWIVGGGALLGAWADSNEWAWLDAAKAQTEHAEWHGFTFWDLIFPLFLFVAGVALPLSVAKRRAAGASDGELAQRAVRRGLALVSLGLVYNGALKFDFETLRYPSVLGRIGLAWMFAALIALRTSWRGQLAWIVALLVGYWAALTWIPVPGFGAGNLAPGANLTDWIDRSVLPGKLYKGVRDPEGLFATLPAIATALGGALAGTFLTSERSPAAKVAQLALAGAALIALGAAWGLVFPLNKNLWTSSFAVWCAGWSALLLALFYLAVDVAGWRRGALFFEVIGANAILIYVLQSFVDFEALARLLLEKRGALKLHAALAAGGGLALKWLLLYALYRRRWFLRV